MTKKRGTKQRRRRQDYLRWKLGRELRQNALAEPGVHDFSIVLDHLKPEYNPGKIFRSADAFGARSVHLVGIDYFDPVPAKGSVKWVPAHFHRSINGCFNTLCDHGYSLIAFAPGTEAQLGTFRLPEKCAFIFGHEEFGLSFDPGEFPEVELVTIPQYGKVQSLNVSVAASLAMYEYCRQHSVSTAPDRMPVQDKAASIK